MSVKVFKLNFKNRKGTTTILFAVSFFVIAAISALVIDIGMVIVEKQRFQNALDAATLAAASDLPNKAKATSTINNYIVKNGFKSSDVSISFTNSDKQITLEGSKDVNYSFAKLIGFDKATLTPTATAAMGIVGTAFDFALFSGSLDDKLTLNGSGDYIYGDIHSNFTVVVNGSKITVTGQCDAVSTITVNGSKINIGSQTPNSEYIEMPDLSDAIKKQAIEAGTYYVGNMIFNSNNISVDKPIYVDGDVTVDGSHFIGNGSILATGNITINGSNLNASTSDAVCFYSKSGNITFNGSNSNLDGILYAPNGTITMNGSNQSINGRVIGNSLSFNGGNLSIISSTNDITSLPRTPVLLVN